MRFHVDTDIGSEISLWIAPDHPDQVPRISIWNGQHRIAMLEANLLRDDVRQLGMHSTGQVGFSITSSSISDIDRMAELMVVVEEERNDEHHGLVIYRRAGGLLNRGERLLILDTGSRRTDLEWNATLGQYAQSYPNLDIFNLETLLSVLGNELAPSIAAVGFPYLSRIRSILSSSNYRMVMMFRDPIIELARQIDHRITIQEKSPSNGQRTASAVPERRALITMLREMTETEVFDLSNPVMRRLLKAPGEQVSPKDVPNALRQLAQFELVATDQTRDHLIARGEGDPILLPSASAISERHGQVVEHLRNIGIATDMIAEDLTLYELVSAAITRACVKLPAPTSQGKTA